jgi:hypothetical protein
MGEAYSTGRDFLTYEQRFDRCGETGSIDGRREPEGKFTKANDSGTKSGSDFDDGPSRKGLGVYRLMR